MIPYAWRPGICRLSRCHGGRRRAPSGFGRRGRGRVAPSKPRRRAATLFLRLGQRDVPATSRFLRRPRLLTRG